MIKVIKWIREHKLYTALIAISIFLFPLLTVHILFRIPCPIPSLEAIWGSGDMLSYIAGFESLLGTGTLSLLALWQNLKFKEENDKKDELLLKIENEKVRLSYLPQFLIETATLDRIIDDNLASAFAEDNTVILLRNMRTYAFLYYPDKKGWNPSDKEVTIEKKLLNNSFLIVNCGNNTAHQVRCKIIINGVAWECDRAISVKKDEGIFFYIGMNNLEKIDMDIELRIQFYDCFQNIYVQEFQMKVEGDVLLIKAATDVQLCERNNSMDFIEF